MNAFNGSFITKISRNSKQLCANFTIVKPQTIETNEYIKLPSSNIIYTGEFGRRMKFLRRFSTLSTLFSSFGLVTTNCSIFEIKII